MVYAQEAVALTGTLGGIGSLADIFAIAINVVMGVGITLTIIFLILGGIQYMTARGDQQAAADARAALTNAIIGFIVVIGAFTIKTIVLNVLGAGEVDTTQLDNVVPF